MIYVTSDTHFSHNNIREYCNRPFDTIHQMNKEILDNINDLVRPTDKLFFLGDFCFGSRDKVITFLDKIKCKHIYYVYGNHDNKFRKKIAKHKKIMFAGDYLEHKPRNNLNLVMTHYPLLTWNKSFYNKLHPQKIASINLFGHCHGGLKNHSPFQLDVGVDSAYQLTGEYRPFFLNEIIRIIETRIQEEEK